MSRKWPSPALARPAAEFVRLEIGRGHPGQMPYSIGDLKRQLYGSSHPSLSVETGDMKAAAERLSRNLTTIDRLFPDGFGALAKTLRAW